MNAHKNGIVKIHLWYKDKAWKEKIKREGLSHLSWGRVRSDGVKNKGRLYSQPSWSREEGERWLSCQVFLIVGSSALLSCSFIVFLSSLSFPVNRQPVLNSPSCMICSSPALEPFYWMPPCHLMTPALEWDTQSFSFFTLRLFTTEVVSQLQAMLKPKGQRENAHRHSGASSGIKKKKIMFPNKLEFMFYHCAYIFIFKFWNSSLPNSLLFTFFIVHTFLETWLLDCVSDFFFQCLL